MTALNRPSSWVGFENYWAALTNAGFQQAALQTMYFTVVSVSLELLLGVLVGLLLNQRFCGRSWVRVLLVVSLAIPTLVNAMTWRWIYNPEFGAFNALLTQLKVIPEY